MLPAARTLQLLKNKVVIVTGGGSGIGAAISRRLGTEGAKVVVADINRENGQAVVDGITKVGGQATSTHVDVGNESSIKAMVDFATKTYGRLDGAVNNAGYAHAPIPLVDLDFETWDRSIRINLGGVFFGVKHQLKAMETAGNGGSIVNMSSGAGLAAIPSLSAYSTAKHGVVGVTRNAAAEYASQNIRFNAICPGAIRTPMMQSQSDQGNDESSLSIPMKRMGEPDEIAKVAIFLLSDNASYMTGQCLSVNGGWIM